MADTVSFHKGKTGSVKAFFKKLWDKFKKLIKWVWTQLKDRTNLVIFIICFIVLSSEVWLTYILGIIFHNGWLIGVGTVCWAFWLGPFTPFLPICIALTLGVRKIYDKIKKSRERKKEMRMKFKSTTKNTKALLYKRFIGLQASKNINIVYNTVEDGLFWTFDNETLTFSKLEKAEEEFSDTTKIVKIPDTKTVVQYQTTYFHYIHFQWETITDLNAEGITLLSASFNNIGRYQTNKYYYAGSFDFMVKGSIEGTTTQFIKGNIIPLTSINIKHFNDDIVLTEDDLVVIDKHLYSVENPETDIKHQPKDYNIYFATLNSIL